MLQLLLENIEGIYLDLIAAVVISFAVFLGWLSTKYHKLTNIIKNRSKKE